ncbi:uncharacterized protein FFFS_16040 [Fusarium fujikuroi]|nr:uncharacterized protein FFFS_16040 [Fusarium fujikuroi]
MLFNKS